MKLRRTKISERKRKKGRPAKQVDGLVVDKETSSVHGEQEGYTAKKMTLPHVIAKFQLSHLPSTSYALRLYSVADVSSSFCTRKFLKPPSLVGSSFRRSVLRVKRTAKEVNREDWEDEEEESENDVRKKNGLMDDEERREWRKTIRDVLDKYPNIEEEMDPEERKLKMQKLVKEYPLVVNEDDPDWPEDADGWGFNLDQFFNKITIKNVKKDDDENYDSDKELVWQDDDYIRPIKDLATADWEEAVFKDISPLILLVHNRYRRPKENQKCRDELEKAVNIIWNCRLPSPRVTECVAIDAVVETDLVSALQVSAFPELIFTKAGKVLYREKAFRTADELSKIMAFFYYGAAKPPFFNYDGDSEEVIPCTPTLKLGSH
ncbi:hypothetical protein V2J09_001859 [Rumex salicifolius]